MSPSRRATTTSTKKKTATKAPVRKPRAAGKSAAKKATKAKQPRKPRKPKAPAVSAANLEQAAAEVVLESMPDSADSIVPTLPNVPVPSPPAGPRRAIFIDVENTSSEADVLRVLDELAINRETMATDLAAVGNWRVVGQQLARTLAERGAQLVHSAPATRVRDWSDLWIAVAAGMWLGRAAPNDILDIVSDDKAFDAVGDAAARLGVTFNRISSRTHSSTSSTSTRTAGAGRSSTSRGSRRSRGGRRSGASRQAPAATPKPTAAPTQDAQAAERLAASLDDLRTTLARLCAADPERGVSLDALALALKAAGYQRPPGSPRLITRLRRIHDVEVLPSGRVRLKEGAEAPTEAAVESPDAPAADASEPETATEGEKPPTARRPRRRGGRRRSRRSNAAAT